MAEEITAGLIRPEDHQRFLGKHFVSRQHETVLRIGAREYDRVQLAQELGITNVAAAGHLSTVLRKAGVRSANQLYEVDPRELAAVEGLGETTVYVALAVLAAAGFDTKGWWERMMGFKGKQVTFRTLKIHERKRAPKGRRGNGTR